MSAEYVTISQRRAKVVARGDVAVVGGGYPGVCAAVAAARAGASVVLLERDGMIGGQAPTIYTFGLDAVLDEEGRQIIKGIPWEIIQKTYALGNSDPVWDSADFGLLAKEGYDRALAPLCRGFANKQEAFLDRNDYRYVCQQLLAEAGVKVLLEAQVTDTIQEGEVISGVVFQAAFEPCAVKAGVVVDTSPQAVVAAAAGKWIAHRVVYTGSHPHVTGVNVKALIKFVLAHPDDVKIHGLEKPTDADLQRRLELAAPMQFTGFRELLSQASKEDSSLSEIGRCDGGVIFFHDSDGNGSYWINAPELYNADLDDPVAFSEKLLGMRRHQWLTHKFFKNHVPGFESSSLGDTHPHIARVLEISKEPGGFTDYDVTWREMETGSSTRPDLIIRIMGHPERGQSKSGWLLPYAALLPQGLEGLLVTGKPACRFIHYHGTCAAVGQAAGVAAALAASKAVTPRELEPAAVREALNNQGVVTQ